MSDTITPQGYDYPDKVQNPFWGSTPTPTPGTRDYDELINKPSINGVTLEGELSLEDLGISQVTISALTEEQVEAVEAVIDQIQFL